MKKSVAVRTVLLFLSFGLVFCKEIRVGFYENYSKVFTDKNGQPAGLFIDVLNHIAKKENWKLTYIHGNWDECLTRLTNGGIDLMIDVAYSEPRNQIYDFATNEVVANWGQIYTRPIFTLLEIKNTDA